MNFGSEVELSFTKLGWVRKPAGLKYHQHVGYSYILSCLACHVTYTKTCIFWLILMVSVGKYHINGCFGYC